MYERAEDLSAANACPPGAVEVTLRFFGTDDLAFTFTAFDVLVSPQEPGTRSYTSLSQSSKESVDARVQGRAHFREGCVKGVRQGEKAGCLVIQHVLRPLRGR
jgi:hypothetical protein